MGKIVDMPLPIHRRRAPRLSPPGVRLMVGLMATCLGWAGICALVSGSTYAGLVAMLASRTAEWFSQEHRQ